MAGITAEEEVIEGGEPVKEAVIIEETETNENETGESETVRVDDGSVVHTSEAVTPPHDEIHHVLSEEAQAVLDKLVERLTANFDRHVAGSPLKAEMYNKMNDMFVEACNQNNVNIFALEEYILKFLPNFIDVYLDDETGPESPLVGTINEGVLVIDLRSQVNKLLAGTLEAAGVYTDDRLTEMSLQFADSLQQLRSETGLNLSNAIKSVSSATQTLVNNLHDEVRARDEALISGLTNLINNTDKATREYSDTQNDALRGYIDERLEDGDSPLVPLTEAEIIALTEEEGFSTNTTLAMRGLESTFVDNSKTITVTEIVTE